MSFILCSSGFSTRDNATNTSGRGVGLDIVNNMISEFNGKIELTTTLDVGTTFRLTIPKLRAVNIIDALIVRCTNSLFALSIDKVISLQGYSVDQIQATMDQERFVKYLGEPVALFDLQELLGGGPTEQINPDVVPIVIIEGKTEQIAVTVSEFLAPQKLVNVPLETEMFGSTAAGIAGTCIISGGNVGLTVDIDRIVEIATGCSRSIPEADLTDNAFALSLEDEDHQAEHDDTHNVKIIHDASGEIESKKKLQGRFMDNGDGSTLGTSLNQNDISDLLDEIRRGLNELQNSVLTLEDEPDNGDVMRDVFRRLHAIKGNFTMLGEKSPSQLTHGLETFMDYVRKGMISIDGGLIDLVLDGVTELIRIASALPKESGEVDPDLMKRVQQEISQYNKQLVVTDNQKLMEEPFNLHPIVELQLLGALKNHAHTFETFLQFENSRQANYLVAYLILRKLCYYGDILDTIPSIEKIEKGECGNAIKILWASRLTGEEVDDVFNDLAPFYKISEHHSMTTNVFRYESSKQEF